MLRIIFIFIVIAGCATTYEPAQIAYQYNDNPELKRVDLFFRNETDTAICLTADDWPNASGELDSMGGRVFLNVDGKRFPIVNHNTGYCPSGCERRVAPGEEVSGFLLYQDFNLPAKLAYKPKVLDFTPNALTCS